MRRLATVAIGLWIVTAAGARAGEERCTCPMGREYFLYPPDAPAARKLWLVVGVHGYRGDGRGAAGLANWAARGDVVVVGPSFPDGYQGLGLETDAQLIDIFGELRKRFALHPKLFVHGFSGGAQFAHRFTLAHPDIVAGCSAHSGGTWEDRVNPAAVGVPFAVSCGENDTGRSTPTSPLGRREWFEAFVGRLEAGGFSYKARTWPGVGHEASPEAVRMVEECFLLATTGMHEPERGAVQAELATIGRMIGAGRRDEARRRIETLARPDAARPGRPAPRAAGKTAGDAGAAVPARPEDARGWRMSPQGREAAAAAREAYVRDAAAEITARIEASSGRDRTKPARTKSPGPNSRVPGIATRADPV